jgi:hypothetical protein
MKRLLGFIACWLAVVSSGCVAEPVGLSIEDLATVLPPGEPNNGINIPPNMLDLDLGDSPTLSEAPCRCEWEIWESDGMVCLGEVCSETCSLNRCRQAVDVCQPL